MLGVDVVIGQVVPAVGAAIGAYGVGVLSRAEDEAADATVRLGQRLLRLILRRSGRRASIESAVTDLAAASEDPDALAALRLQLRMALAEDGSLLAELAALLPERPAARADGPRGVGIAGQVTGIVSTGDGATNIQLR